MHVAGVVAEYNPFHLGHQYQLEQTRRRLGEDTAVVCVMSGNFVQRGEAAILNQRARTECALMGGADLILELPTPWAAASAEIFARGAVEILAATGVVDTLSFGCEGGETESLAAAADCLLTPEYRALMGSMKEKNLPFAALRQTAASALIGSAADCLTTPNNNLAVEYLKALRTLKSEITPMAIPRRGAGHDAAGQADGLASASAIRRLIEAGNPDGAGVFLPQGTREILARELALGRAPARLATAERAVLGCLRAMEEGDFAALPDSGPEEGLSHRLAAAARSGTTLEEVYRLAKTKRYAHSRIRRLVLWAFLGLTAEDRPEAVPYIRVLGMNQTGRALLRRMGKTCLLPVITKPAHARRLDGPAKALFEAEARCTDRYALCTPTVGPCGEEWKSTPVVLP